jgi:hypothetical protein
MVASDCSAIALGTMARGFANCGTRTPRRLHTVDKYGFVPPPHCAAARVIAASPTRWRNHPNTRRSFSLQTLTRCSMTDSPKTLYVYTVFGKTATCKRKPGIRGFLSCAERIQDTSHVRGKSMMVSYTIKRSSNHGERTPDHHIDTRAA